MAQIDVHIHLADYPEPLEVVRYAQATGSRLLATSTDRASSERNLALAARFGARVEAFVGIHPSEAMVSGGEIPPSWLERALVDALGAGEIGLDPRYSDVSEPSPQMKLFSYQLSLAEKLQKPVQVHTRGAERLSLEGLSSHTLSRVLLHWFESEELAVTAAGKGYYVSFGPALLYSKRLARMASTYPEDLILTESDGPVTFAPLGGTGGPCLVPSVLFRLSELRRKTYQEMSDAVWANSLSYLGAGTGKKG